MSEQDEIVKELDQAFGTREGLVNEIQKSEKKLKELRNLHKDVRSKIFIEESFLRYIKDRLKWVEEGRVS